MKKKISEAALKLRFTGWYKNGTSVKSEINALGRDVLKRSGIRIPETPLLNGKEVPPLPSSKEKVTLKQEIPRQELTPEPREARTETESRKSHTPSFTPETEERKSTFLYQLAHLQESLQNLETMVIILEEAQKRQLDLSGFIEHLLAVERT